MKMKHLPGLFLFLAVACTNQQGIPTTSLVGGEVAAGGSSGYAGGATGGTDGSVPAGSSGGSAGGLTGAAGTTNGAGRNTTGGAMVGGESGGTGGAGLATGGTVGTAGLAGSTAGAAGAGTTGSTGGGCEIVDACVGEAVGKWKVTSSCLRSSGRSDIRDFGLPCVTAEITGTVSVTGTLLLTPDGKYADKTVTTGSETWVLDEECLQHWAVRVTCATIGTYLHDLLPDSYDDFTCADAASGDGCTCQGRINQSGGMGVLYNDIWPSGPYKVEAGTLVLGDVLTYSLCAETGSRLTLSPQPAPVARPYTGSIVFVKTTD